MFIIIIIEQYITYSAIFSLTLLLRFFFPLAFLCLHGEGSLLKVRLQGMLFVHRIFELAPVTILNAIGRVLYSQVRDAFFGIFFFVGFFLK